jgi:hypothetical protein
MLEMWVLVWISLYDPAYGVSVDSLGTYPDHESCVYEMREAEIMINRSNEGMLCLRVGPEPEDMEDTVLRELEELQ